MLDVFTLLCCCSAFTALVNLLRLHVGSHPHAVSLSLSVLSDTHRTSTLHISDAQHEIVRSSGFVEVRTGTLTPLSWACVYRPGRSAGGGRGQSTVNCMSIKLSLKSGFRTVVPNRLNGGRRALRFVCLFSHRQPATFGRIVVSFCADSSRRRRKHPVSDSQTAQRAIGQTGVGRLFTEWNLSDRYCVYLPACSD